MPFTDQNEVEFKVSPRYGNGFEHITIHVREYANFKARMAAVLIEKWGLVATAPDGEDSAGRAKLRRLSPEELVQEAVSTADHAVEEFRRRGWMLEVPPIEKEDD